MGHDHGSAAAGHRGRLVAVLALSLTILVVEVIGAAVANSLALLADAGHVLTDVVGIALALAAIWFAQRPPTNGRTFGYLRLEILAAVTNAFLLFGIAAFVLYEAWRRLSDPPEIASGAMLAFALVGLVANVVSLLLLRDAQKESLNMRGAYLEVMGDLAGSVAVIGAAVVIAVTGWTGADIVASVLIGLLILPRTFSLLRDATNVLLEATREQHRAEDREQLLLRQLVGRALALGERHVLAVRSLRAASRVTLGALVLRLRNRRLALGLRRLRAW